MSDSALRPGSDEEWENLLHQLRLQPKGQPRPFFYARVRARLATERQPASFWLANWRRRPAYAALFGALILAMSGDGAAQPPAAASQHATQPARPVLRLPH